MTQDLGLPDDDRTRQLTTRRVGDAGASVVQLVGDTYTVLVSGDDTRGRFTVIDMVIPPGGGPPPHRHDFEETFSVLSGAVEVTSREQTSTLRAGGTANVPANAPHWFKNTGSTDAHMLCICSPAGQDEMFIRAGAGEDPAVLLPLFRSELVTDASQAAGSQRRNDPTNSSHEEPR